MRELVAVSAGIVLGVILLTAQGMLIHDQPVVSDAPSEIVLQSEISAASKQYEIDIFWMYTGPLQTSSQAIPCDTQGRNRLSEVSADALTGTYFSLLDDSVLVLQSPSAVCSVRPAEGSLGSTSASKSDIEIDLVHSQHVTLVDNRQNPGFPTEPPLPLSVTLVRSVGTGLFVLLGAIIFATKREAAKLWKRSILVLSIAASLCLVGFALHNDVFRYVMDDLIPWWVFLLFGGYYLWRVGT
ncbi:hypothetical protein KKG90_10050 [Candidatus Bipolaricaulota bacterium]|nr:hypothetical protein [Candidatus Bipolaricaulota bacterium]